MRARLINESIKPDRELFEQFKQIFLEVKESRTNDPFFELNEKLNPLNIYLVDYKQHFDALDPAERKQFQQANMIPELGIRVMGFDPPTNQIFIVCDDSFDDKFMRVPPHIMERMLDRMWSGFGHETIHMQQVEKMKVKQDPKFHSKDEYFGNKQEIMAMAFSFIQEMRDFHSDKEIMDLLRTGNAPPPPPPPPGMRGFGPPRGMMMPPMPMHHPLYAIYKELGGDAYKLFTKYAYKYLTEE
jgi:hypothetical protein